VGIKQIFYKITSSIRNSEVDDRAQISYFVKFYDSRIEAFSYVSNNCNVFHTKIGKYTSIGLGCNIGGGEHPLDWVSTSPVFQKGRTFAFGFEGLPYEPYKETTIGNDVFIAPETIIKTGVHIADGAVIGAGAVVVKDIGPYEVWAGNPARFIKKRFSDEIIEQFLELEWWKWDEDKVAKYASLFNSPEQFLKVCRNDGEFVK